VERRALLDLRLGPHSATLPEQESLHGRQAEAVALEQIGGVETLEGAEELLGIVHVEAGAVVAHNAHAEPCGRAPAGVWLRSGHGGQLPPVTPSS
jgi:hypothetical protein